VGADALGLSVGDGTRSGMQLELGSSVSGYLGNGWSLRGDAALYQSLTHRASVRSATLHGAGDHAFAVPGLAPSGMDYRVMLGADYRYRRTHLGGAVMAERLLGVLVVRRCPVLVDPLVPGDVHQTILAAQRCGARC